MRRLLSLILAGTALFAVASPLPAQAAWPDSYVKDEAGARRFALSNNGTSAPLLVSSLDLPGVRRATGDLRDDIGRVTGAAPRLLSDSAPGARQVVLVERSAITR